MARDSSYSLELAEFAARFDYDKIPPEVTRNVRFRLLDTTGACLASLDYTGRRTSHEASVSVHLDGVINHISATP